MRAFLVVAERNETYRIRVLAEDTAQAKQIVWSTPLEQLEVLEQQGAASLASTSGLRIRIVREVE